MKRMIIALALIVGATAAYADVYRPLATWTVASNPYTSTAATTAAGDGVNVIRVMADTDVFFNVGVSPNASASATAMLIPAYTPEYFNIGTGEQVAVFSVSATGTVYITEMTK